ncbi:MAG: rhomboid family intramembrane serine protease [Bacteroidia bacterium]|nr:rhomboid family intramembrane serine protease [Bacteroidia bacterium]MCZ2276385.1 rhomboid family intramembrane serine protease [Bacteroidia bacterium]
MTSEKHKIIASILFPLLFITLLWIIKIIEVYTNLSFVSWGVYPRIASGLKGILTSPLIHEDWEHLISNSIPLFILGALLIYFYHELWLRSFIWIYMLSGFWLWLSGRDAFHIGASGIVYGLTAFLFISGILRRHTGLMAVSLVVVFLYGGLIWGILPFMVKMSWEAHLSGLMAGTLIAFYYRRVGLQRQQYDWENEEEDLNNPEETNNSILPESHQPVIRYIYKPQENNQTDDEQN